MTIKIRNHQFQLSRRTCRPLSPSKLRAVFKTLLRHFGPQDWWPGETPFEVMVGAILTQNTAWINVEKAIGNLKRNGHLSPEAIAKISHRTLAKDIQPAGYFNVKAVRLKNFVHYFNAVYGGNLKLMKARGPQALRAELLGVNGIGPETADSILLYALGKSVFVVDAYTKRVFSRHRMVMSHRGSSLRMISPGKLFGKDYHEWQRLFTDHLSPPNLKLYNEFHALIVALGKNYCRPQRPKCSSCPLKTYL